MRRSPVLVSQSAIPENANLLLRHPIFAWVGLRPVFGQHTAAEHAALKKWASQRERLVEIGVAEGGSAIVLRQAMSPSAILWLIDPFHLSRNRMINATKRVAHKTVEGSKKGSVVWIEKFSFDAIRQWDAPIDFLFIDGDHSEAGVNHDWENWHRFVLPGGVVAFHDAATFPGGWPKDDWAPVKLVNRLFRDQRLPEWALVEEVDSLVLVERI